MIYRAKINDHRRVVYQPSVGQEIEPLGYPRGRRTGVVIMSGNQTGYVGRRDGNRSRVARMVSWSMDVDKIRRRASVRRVGHDDVCQDDETDEERGTHCSAAEGRINHAPKRAIPALVCQSGGRYDRRPASAGRRQEAGLTWRQLIETMLPCQSCDIT